MRKLVYTLAAAAALAAVPAQSQAQVVVGPYLAFHDDADLGVGGFAAFAVPSIDENASVVADFGYYFPDGFDFWEINLNGLYRFTVESEDVSPFAIAGLNIARIEGTETFLPPGGGEPVRRANDNTDLGINLGGGVTFLGLGNLRPSAGIKIELSGGEGFILFGALGFPVGGPSDGM